MSSVATTVADIYRYVVGVDTHAATHSYAVVAAPNGALVDQATFPTSAAGLRRASEWIGRRTGGDLDAVLVAAEGIGSHGAVLGEVLQAAGYRVVEAPTPRRERGRGKTDTLDAVLAARSTLVVPLTLLRDRRSGGDPGCAAGAHRRPGSPQRRPTALHQRAHRRGPRPRPGHRRTPRTDDTADLHDRCLASPRRDAGRGDGAGRGCPPGQADPRHRRRAGRQPRPDHPDRHDAGTRAARPARCRRDHRRGDPDRLVPPWPDPQRGRVRSDRRHLSHPGILGQHDPPPAQPRRRPPTQQGLHHHRAHQDAHRPRNPRPTSTGARPRARRPRRSVDASSATRPGRSSAPWRPPESNPRSSPQRLDAT
jgi:hypothetical protein